MPRLTVRRAALAAGVALATLSAGLTHAQVPTAVEVDRFGDTTRIRLVLPERAGGELSAEAEVAAGAVLIARLSDSIDADLSPVLQDASDYVAMSRLDPDGRTLRLALNQALEPRISVSHNVIAIDLAPPGAAPLADVVSPYEEARRAEAVAAAARAAAAAAAANAPLPALPVTVRVGEAAEYTRVVFSWPEPVTYALEQTGGRAVLSFSRLAEVDLGTLRAAPPRFIDTVTPLDADGLSLAFVLAGEVEARVWSDEPGRVVFDVAPAGGGNVESVLAALSEYADTLTAPVEPDAAPSEPEVSEEPYVPAQPEIDPVPETGIVPIQPRNSGQDLVLSMPWRALPGAAVFRRDDAIWIVFDAEAELDTAQIAAVGGRHVRGYQAMTGPGYSALRIESPASTQADVRAAGATWTVTLAETVNEPTRPVQIARDTGFNRPALLRFGLDNARAAREVVDPVVGDTLLVLTADGEKRGVISPRRFTETALLPSAHGVALQTFVDDLELTLRAGGAELTRPGGLTLSRAANPALGQNLDRPVSAGFLDLERWRGDQAFLAGRYALERRASSLDPEALLALARFYLGWELSTEALGVAELAVEENAALDDAPEIAALRGVASYMIGRVEDAETYLSHPGLANDEAAQPWRGLTAARSGNWPLARRRFEDGRDTLFFFDPVWRARISAMHALAALKTNDLGAVEPLLNVVEAEPEDPQARAEAAFVAAGLAAASGDIDAALDGYAALASSDWLPIQAPALLEKVRLEVEHDLIDAEAAVDALESLRFRWRGDDTEVEAAAMLGEVYAQAGRYSEALSTMASARSRFTESPVARQLSVRMETVFRDLYLGDGADRMDPLEALALWYEHQELTPLGPDGLRMARRVAERLVEVDLLEPAAELLAHQVFDRRVTMTAMARAEIASDLARVYLIDGRPEDALRAIESTRIAGLPQALVQERRLLQARALADLGRTEHGLELIAADESPAADLLRADIAWAGRRWSDAGRLTESLLGSRWRDDAPLSADESHGVLRALIAYALAGDRGGMDRIAARYGPAMAQTDHGAAFSMVATESMSPGDARLGALVSGLGDLQSTSALMAGFNRSEAGGAES